MAHVGQELALGPVGRLGRIPGPRLFRPCQEILIGAGKPLRLLDRGLFVNGQELPQGGDLGFEFGNPRLVARQVHRLARVSPLVASVRKTGPQAKGSTASFTLSATVWKRVAVSRLMGVREEDHREEIPHGSMPPNPSADLIP